jgi:hypothetical protein
MSVTFLVPVTTFLVPVTTFPVPVTTFPVPARAAMKVNLVEQTGVNVFCCVIKIAF